jgi:zinc transporter ZupT
MTTPHAPVPRQLLLWMVIIGTCAIVGLVLLVFALVGFPSEPTMTAVLRAVGAALVAFGLVTAVIVARRQRRIRQD